MQQDWASPEQVAEQLGLHVRTIRSYIRDGRLPAARIGKQYRIARADLDAFTAPSGASADRADAAVVAPQVEVSAVVEIDELPASAADRLTTLVVAGAQGPSLRVQTIYDSARSHLKVIILGSAPATADVLHTINVLLAADSGLLTKPVAGHE